MSCILHADHPQLSHTLFFFFRHSKKKFYFSIRNFVIFFTRCRVWYEHRRASDLASVYIIICRHGCAIHSTKGHEGSVRQDGRLVQFIIYIIIITEGSPSHARTHTRNSIDSLAVVCGGGGGRYFINTRVYNIFYTMFFFFVFHYPVILSKGFFSKSDFYFFSIVVEFYWNLDLTLF